MAQVVPNLSTQKIKFTYQDYLLLPDDGKRYEIIEGEMYMTPSPSLRHQDILRELFRKIDQYVLENRLGVVYVAPCDVIFSDSNIVQPDLIYISKENRDIIKKQNINGTPDLLIEITSPKTKKRDLVFKKRLYAKFGVEEYWIVYPDEEKIEVYCLGDSKLDLFLRTEKSDILKSKVFANLKIKTSEVFRDSGEYF